MCVAVSVCAVVDAPLSAMSVHVAPSALTWYLVMLALDGSVHARAISWAAPVPVTKSADVPVQLRSCHLAVVAGPAVHARATCVFPAVAANPAGADGAASGVAVTRSDSGLTPCGLAARMRKPYIVPFVSPVKEWAVVDAPLLGISPHASASGICIVVTMGSSPGTGSEVSYCISNS